jgi:hypothetical protein
MSAFRHTREIRGKHLKRFDPRFLNRTRRQIETGILRKGVTKIAFSVNQLNDGLPIVGCGLLQIWVTFQTAGSGVRLLKKSRSRERR